MGKLNYFTDEFSVIRLRNYFDSLDIKELRYELKKFINQYLNLTEEQQFKYAEYILVICRRFEDQIDKETEKNILELLDRIFLQNNLKTDISQKYKYLELLYFYLFRVDEYEEYSVLFKDYSFFLNILDSIVEGKIENYMYSSIVSALISVFYRVFRMTSFPKKELEYLEKRLKKFINVIYLKVEFKTIDYWYFELDELVSIFKIEHLETISSYYINNPQSDYVGKYLDFVSRHFDDIIEDSIAVIRKIAKENNSDIIRDQAIKLIEKYDKDYLNEKSDLESISSLDPNQLLVQADKIIYYIRSKLTVDAKDLKTIGSFGHYTKIDTLTNFLIKADWKDDNKNENDSKVKPPYLRLTNLKQLNDPMEGRAIYDYLGIDSTFFHNYQTSNVFISSLTVVSDSLPMWKEYADSSQGAFLEYDMTYLEQIVAHQSIEFVKIHYLDLNSGAKDESDVGKALDNLKQIFEKMQEFEGKTPLSDLAEKLKKISYLFKVKDYEYEMEYRILINLDDTSVKKLIAKHNKSLDKNKDLLKGKDLLNENYLKKEEIGLETFDKVNYNDFRKYIVLSPKDNGRYALFVYINLAPLKYSKVILGPKVTDADYIAPYLKLANPDIEIESSKIPYR
ncbi:hypothetical protein HMPREF9184_01191 [Streptococcus sp. oral taxon 058 str. F0407]|uniref:DUF2971 domain-containing protein n=1 Tax=Streptococcus sp. oral taxon 058 TaxID=712622 RepID=UPI000234A878|nr:DUF2971 domain-containing protein [Streptococcus sp. oral taxon 058]EHI76546.1 hypothetical protein HMPREF9184_01191 [Streptococcus sp. oral taxon 058 str. F0407]